MTRSIVVTDASKGIGRAAADVLVQQRWSVIGVARSSPGSSPGELIQTDLAQNLDETRVLANDLAARRNVLGIVDNAGIAKHEMIDAVELDVFTAVMDLNVRPALQLPSSITWNAVRAIRPHLQRDQPCHSRVRVSFKSRGSKKQR